MGVALRNEAPPIYYLYHLHRGDPSLHAIDCPHFIAQEYVERAPQLAKTDLPEEAPSSADSDANLPAVLDQLLVGAGLNKWQANWLGKRSFVRVRARLLEACLHVKTPHSGSPLAECVYFPPLWDPSLKEAIEEEWGIFLATLTLSKNGGGRAYVMGTARSLEVRPDWSAPKLQLASHNTPFWLTGIPSLIPYPADPNHTWLVLLELAASQSKQGYRVVDGASMLLSAQWIPAHSHAHAHLADHLVSEGLAFTASLAHDPTTAWSVPDFTYTAADGVLCRRGPFGTVRVARRDQ